jgi:hypothetical protein
MYPTCKEREVSHGKFTGGLLRALESASASPDELLPIFIELGEPPSADQATVLREAGVTSAVEGLDIITANLNRPGIELLSEQPWVMALTLSEKLRPLQCS